MKPGPRGDDTTLPPENLTAEPATEGAIEVTALAVLWCRDEPARAGEVLLVPPSLGAPAWLFGRGDAGAGRLGLARQRPGNNEVTGPLGCARISREQLRIAPKTGVIENVGRCALVHDGREVSSCAPSPGDLLELRNELLFLCVRRPLRLPSLPEGHFVPPAFGEPDGAGILGESAPIWALRQEIAVVARLAAHVLVLGASGSGKELVARAIHLLSPRSRKAMVARNAATIPEGIADAELFGNLKSYPNPGMPERPGLVGEADGSTLFLDEFAELPVSSQARLLRVLDEGEYQRLGEATARRADLRLVAATNRPEDALKHDVLARLKARIRVPDLDRRREDVPLLAAHLLRAHAAASPDLLARFFPNADRRAPPRISPALMGALAQHRYTTHVRELDALLLRAALGSRGKYLELTSDVLALLQRGRDATSEPDAGEDFTAEERMRLDLQRRHGFSATDCGNDPAYPGNRQTADFHLRQLMCRALALSGWRVDRAAARMAGDGDVVTKAKLVERVETFLQNLERRRERLAEEGASDPDAALARALGEEWRGSAKVVLAVVEALAAQRIKREKGAR